MRELARMLTPGIRPRLVIQLTDDCEMSWNGNACTIWARVEWRFAVLDFTPSNASTGFNIAHWQRVSDGAGWVNTQRSKRTITSYDSRLVQSQRKKFQQIKTERSMEINFLDFLWRWEERTLLSVAVFLGRRRLFNFPFLFYVLLYICTAQAGCAVCCEYQSGSKKS